MLGKLLSKSLRVLELLSSNNFSTSPLDVRPLLVTGLPYMSRETSLHSCPLWKELVLSIRSVAGLLPQAKGAVQQVPHWARGCLHGAHLPGGPSTNKQGRSKTSEFQFAWPRGMNKHT